MTARTIRANLSDLPLSVPLCNCFANYVNVGTSLKNSLPLVAGKKCKKDILQIYHHPVDKHKATSK